MSDTTVVDDSGKSRFELNAEGRLAFIDYTRDGDRLTTLHTEVPPELEGRGIGTRLVLGALDLMRAHGDRVVPRCPFVRAVIRRHPEYADLVAQE